MKKFFSLFMLPMFFLSCVETIPIDSIPVTKILVVNSLITQDSLFKCYVSKVYPLNDSTPHFVVDASVKIFDAESGSLVCELLHDSAGVYRAKTATPAVGKSYRLVVNANGYPEVKGVTSVPPRQPATNVSITQKVGFEGLLNWYYDELRFSISDQFSTPNYYEALFSSFYKTNYDWQPGTTNQKYYKDSIYCIEDAFGFADFTTVDAVIKAENLMRYNPSTIVFTDNLFNRGQHDFVIRSYDISGKAYSFLLYTLSEDLYKFRTTLMPHLYERGAKGVSRFDDLAGLDFSSQSIDVYSNLTGGYGIFAGYNSQNYFSKFTSITHLVNGQIYYEIVSKRDTLPDGKIRINLDQTINPYEKN